MKFLHTADLHLNDTESLSALSAVIETATTYNCSHILIAGDLFDKNLSYLTIEQTVLSIMEKFSGNILIIPGNHDLEFLKGRNRLSNNSLIFNTDENFIRYKPDESDSLEIIAIPFKHGIELKDLGDISADPSHSILMAHGSFYTDSFFYEQDGRKSYFPIFPEDVKDKFRYVALGHYHRWIKGIYGQTTAINPGSPRITKNSDIGERKVAIVDTADWSAREVILSMPFVETVNITLSAFDKKDDISDKVNRTLGSFIKGNKKEYANLMIKFRGTLPPDFESPVSFREWAEKLINEMSVKIIELNTDKLYQLYPGLTENKFVEHFMEEIKKAAQESGLNIEKSERLAIERMNYLLGK